MSESIGQRLVIVGGGPAGLAAARAYRNAGGEGEVVILAAEEFLPYNRPPLTKEFLRGESGFEDLPIEEEDFYRDNDIELRLRAEVEALDTERRVVRTKGGGEISYGSCLLATGSRPLRIPVPGGDDPEILSMRTIGDSTRLAEKVEGEGRAVAVVGSGFIGCEAAASLAIRGVETTIVSMEESPQRERLGDEVSDRISAWLAGYGVDLRMDSGVEAVERGGEGYQVRMEGGDGIMADAVLFATGVEPRIELAENAGLEIENGAVATDSSMRTSAPDVFAAGDIAFAYNEAAGRRLRVEHWGDALEHGRIAGKNAAEGEAGVEERLSLAPGFWSTIGDKTVKYWAWGDGWDESRFVDHGYNGAFTVWYGKGGVVVGVLTHDAEEDYQRGKDLMEAGASMPR